MTHYFEARVRTVEEKFTKQWVSGTGNEAVFEDVSAGWWVIFEGWPASMRFGATKPDFAPGDIVDLTATKRIAP